jgi:hypothetical protein
MSHSKEGQSVLAGEKIEVDLEYYPIISCLWQITSWGVPCTAIFGVGVEEKLARKSSYMLVHVGA